VNTHARTPLRARERDAVRERPRRATRTNDTVTHASRVFFHGTRDARATRAWREI